jgi:hypothetical protein
MEASPHPKDERIERDSKVVSIITGTTKRTEKKAMRLYARCIPMHIEEWVTRESTIPSRRIQPFIPSMRVCGMRDPDPGSMLGIQRSIYDLTSPSQPDLCPLAVDPTHNSDVLLPAARTGKAADDEHKVCEAHRGDKREHALRRVRTRAGLILLGQL